MFEVTSSSLRTTTKTVSLSSQMMTKMKVVQKLMGESVADVVIEVC